MACKIKSIKGREILDSRGNPTVEVALETDCGVFTDSVPSGASTGMHEAVELRDGNKRYMGKGVLKAVRNINEIIGKNLEGRDVTSQKEIDELLIKLDGTENKSKLGVNAVCGISLAICRTGAKAKNMPLYRYISEMLMSLNSPAFEGVMPTPLFNIINGGAHAGNELDVQEFMIVPVQKNSFSEKLRIASEIYHKLKEILSKTYGSGAGNVGDEGGFAPPIKKPEEAIGQILKAAKELGYQDEIKIVLDVAASQFFSGNKYKMKIGQFSADGLLNYYLRLIEKYPILGMEDPFAEDDWDGWIKLSSKFRSRGSKFLIIGDDLTVTNTKRMKEAKEREACNGMILKINQIGTIWEALQAAKMAKFYGWKIFVKHRSGETNDDFIADFAVGIGADGIMAGAPARGERLAKYNRLLKIEEELKGVKNYGHN